jgi:hypothetical protein
VARRPDAKSNRIAVRRRPFTHQPNPFWRKEAFTSSTIGNLPLGSPAQATDQIPIQRGLTQNFKLLVSDFVSLSAKWANLTGDLTETQVIPWDGAVVGTPDTGISRLGAGSLAIGTGAAGSIAGNLSLNRINKAGADFAGQATVTTGNTTKAVAFGANYTGAGQPVIVLTPTSDPLALGVPVGYWVTYSGSTTAWTGFTVNIQTALAGNVTFNYIVVGVA